MSQWRRASVGIIASIMASPSPTPAETLARIDAAYPFGPRQYHPYKIWLSERAKAKKALMRTPGALGVRCPVCGVRPDAPCVELTGGVFEVQTISEREPHVARIEAGK